MALGAKQFPICQGQRGGCSVAEPAGGHTHRRTVYRSRPAIARRIAAILEGVSGRRGGSNKTTRSDMDGSPLLAAAEQSIEVVQPEPEHAPARPTAGFTVPAAGGDRA